MEPIIWTDEFSVGNEDVDAQHRQLLAMVNRILTYPAAGDAGETISELLNAMTRYAAEHFSLEEQLMRERGYPGLEAHRAEHLAFRKKTVGFCLGLMAGHGEIAGEMQQFLCDWWRSHILRVDRQCRPYFSGTAR